MKRERTTCEKARNICIVRTLAKLGHFPTKQSEKEAWFLSPFRSETQASFKVSKTKNRWFDHGEGIGGNVIDLVCRITKSTVKEALKILNEDAPSFSFQQQPIFKAKNENKIKVIESKELTHFALRDYLESRNIKLGTALRLCKEVHYTFKGKKYFAIGLQNDSGGWELRNKYQKNSSAPKDTTHIKNGNKKLIVTEGMFDMITLLEEYQNMENEYDFMILNSTAFIEKALVVIKAYKVIGLYLDNDFTGKKTARILMQQSSNCMDKSVLYKGYKDLNAWKQAMGH
ncbi:MAG: toprim domain-containing protein [Maribacter sp.]|nr:toprim domain-containing protein [Maribacter sp.]